MPRSRRFKTPQLLRGSGYQFGLAGKNDSPAPDHDRISGDAPPPASSATSSAGSPSRKEHKNKRSSSSSSSSSTTKPKKRRQAEQEDIPTSTFMSAFLSINEALSSIARRLDKPASTAPDPDPTSGNPLPSASASGACEDSDNNSHGGSERSEQPSRGRSSTQKSTHGSDHGTSLPRSEFQEFSSDEEDINSVSGLSPSESRLRLLQKDMIHVLGLPAPTPREHDSEHASFKRHATRLDSSDPIFPELPLDRSCVYMFKTVAKSKKWRPFPPRAFSYYHFPQEDFTNFMSVPDLPDAAKDKIAEDSGKPLPRSIFLDKDKALLEASLNKVDKASRFGLRCSAFLLLLSEYLAQACEEDSPVAPDRIL